MKPAALKALALALLLAAAHGAQALAQTSGRALRSSKPVARLPPKGKRWALVVGVDRYADGRIGQLAGSDNDAHALAEALVENAGFPEDQVMLLSTDRPEEWRPTRANILRRLDNLARLVPADGLLLVSFAGHGVERKGSAYLLPSDAQFSGNVALLENTSISVSYMSELIKATGVRQVVVLLDACRNEPGRGVRAGEGAPNPLTPAFMFDFDVRNREVEAFAVLYATAVGHRAYEYAEKRQGYFTWAVVEGLKGGAADARGEVTLERLVRYVQEKVPERVRIDFGAREEQKPFAVIEGYRAGELVVAVASRETPKPAAPVSAEEVLKPLREMRLPPGYGPGSLMIRIANFSCYSFVAESRSCYVGVYGSGWGVSDVRVLMNGQDVSKQITLQNDAAIQLEGDVKALNLLSGKNVVVVRVGDKESEPYSFIRVIK